MMCWGMTKILLSVCLSECPYLNTRAQHDVSVGMRKILLSVCLSECPYLNTRAQHDVLGDDKDLAVSVSVRVSLPEHQSPA